MEKYNIHWVLPTATCPRNEIPRKIKLGNDWTMVCKRLNQALPRFVEFRRRRTEGPDLVISGEFEILGNGAQYLKRKFVQLLETGFTKTRIELYGSKDRSYAFPCLPSFSLKGDVYISSLESTLIPPSFPTKDSLLVSFMKLAGDFTDLLSSDRCAFPADVVLKCDTAVIPAHKIILSARSPVFAAMFASPMRESQENEVVITDICADVLRTMVIYMYSGNLLQMPEFLMIELIGAADKYQMQHLKEMCCYNLRNKISPTNVCDFLCMGDLCAKELKSFALNYLCQCDNFTTIKNSEEWKSLKSSKPDLAKEVLAHVRDRSKKERKQYKKFKKQIKSIERSRSFIE